MRPAKALFAAVPLAAALALVPLLRGSASRPLPSGPDAAAGVAKALEKEIPLAAARARGRSMKHEQVQALEAAFDSAARGLADAGLLERLGGDTPLGKRLGRMALSVRLSRQLGHAQLKALQAAYLDGFLQDPAQTLTEAKALLSRLQGPELAQERMGIYGVVGALPGVSSEIRDLALNELTQQAPPARVSPAQAGDDPALQKQAYSWGPAQILPLMSYRMYLNAIGNDPEQALSDTLQILAAQPDPGIQRSIASGFISLYPDRKPQLYQQLAQAQIQLPDLQPSAPGPSRISVPPTTLAEDEGSAGGAPSGE
jgi:hypothetical protein